MPSNLLSADTSFPQLNNKQSSDEKIEVMTNYIYMLLEQLRYTLANLGQSNFNDTEFKNIANIITEPVYIQLKDTEGNISALQLTAEGLGLRVTSAEGEITQLTVSRDAMTSKISNLEGDVGTLNQTAASLTSSIADAEGDISVLQQTASTLSSRIEDVDGGIASKITQSLNSMEMSVTNGTRSSTITLTADGMQAKSADINFSGMVTFADLQNTGGNTIINGGNIKTGEINAIDIYGSEFHTVLDGSGNVGGEIIMHYPEREGPIVGGIRLDTSGAGDDEESQHRMFIYTKKIPNTNVAFALKLESETGMSLVADENVHIEGKTTANINSKEIYLNGDVRIKGRLFINGKV